LLLSRVDASPLDFELTGEVGDEPVSIVALELNTEYQLLDSPAEQSVATLTPVAGQSSGTLPPPSFSTLTSRSQAPVSQDNVLETSATPKRYPVRNRQPF